MFVNNFIRNFATGCRLKFKQNKHTFVVTGASSKSMAPKRFRVRTPTKRCRPRRTPSSKRSRGTPSSKGSRGTPSSKRSHGAPQTQKRKRQSYKKRVFSGGNILSNWFKLLGDKKLHKTNGIPLKRKPLLTQIAANNNIKEKKVHLKRKKNGGKPKISSDKAKVCGKCTTYIVKDHASLCDWCRNTQVYVRDDYDFVKKKNYNFGNFKI